MMMKLKEEVRGEREMRGRTRETCSNRLVNRRIDGKKIEIGS